MTVVQFPGSQNGGAFPAFFEDAPVVRMRDPLAEFLSSAKGGVMTYRYIDAVRLAGHSCPAVAGAWLMMVQGLAWLYDEDVPERGAIEVHMRDGRDEGTTGVMASIATLVTGAGEETGFMGIGANHRFSRKGLLTFDAVIDGRIGLRRRDTGQGVIIDINTASVPHDREMEALMPLAISSKADAAQLEWFGALWQDRVRRMLIEHADDPKLVHLYEWRAGSH
ncbi:hypothetical protein [Pelagibacterium mangrovi]|uniref:hypothetical protein n=1 Tax=Pelagibacterium mangrovi TaxID=3119828 RepID=UPI002FCA0003